MPILPTIKEEESQTWLQQLWHCRIQLQLTIPASLIMFAGGLKLAWTVYEAPPNRFDYDYDSCLLIVAFFFGAIVGCIAASMFVGRVSKNIAHITSGSLLVVGGLLFLTFPNSFFALAFTCLFEGIAMGLTQVQNFVVGPEMCSKEMRGFVMSTERCSLWFGILMQLTFTYMWYALEPPTGHRTMQPDQIHGIVVACLGLAAIVAAFKQRVESPLLLIQQQRDHAAGNVLKQLIGTQLTTTEVMRVREDCVQLMAFDAGQSGWYIFRKHNAGPLLKLFILRGFVTLTMSQPFNRVYLSASWLGFNCDTNCLYTMAATGACGSLLGCLLIDRYGRRRMCVATMLPATIFMLITGGIMEYLANTNTAIVQLDLEIIALLMLLFQFIICVGVSIAASVYLSEAFTVTQKPKCVAAVLIGEHTLQLVLALVSSSTTINGMVFFFIMGFLCMLLGLCVFFFMPETKYLTLYECLQKFKRV
ncbi:solute carrier family 2, facilitated glucose transporter member 12 [Musca autumnalis]|uniref:solute carrier family 2, facilitated glucose transporter member 12 n=1 Tax=Musca autumnalis TaxID=221902 RepID=UPI003CF34D41